MPNQGPPHESGSDLPLEEELQTVSKTHPARGHFVLPLVVSLVGKEDQNQAQNQSSAARSLGVFYLAGSSEHSTCQILSHLYFVISFFALSNTYRGA